MNEFDNINNFPEEEPKTEEEINSQAPKEEAPEPEEPKTEEPKTILQEEIKPSNGWNSASFVPLEPKKKKKNFGGLIAIVAIFVIVGMVATIAFGFLKNGNLFNESLTDKSNSSKGESAYFEQYEKPEGADKVTENEDGSYSPDDLYKLTASGVVGVLKYVNGYPQAQGQGSGVIISADGYIVTNAHVVSGADAVSVVLPTDNAEIEAKLIGSDARSDIAVLKIDKTDLPYIKMGNSDKVNVGEMVAAIGNPGGLSLSNSLTVGYISGLDREITVDSYTMNYIQTDAAINPGNSGGALLNMFGQLIGINSAKIAETGYEGIGFAIPINDAIPIIESIIDNGFVKGRVRMGVAVSEISEFNAAWYKMPKGLMVQSIDRDCDAYGKLQKGDIITEINGTEISTVAALHSYLDGKNPGDVVEVKIYRTERNQGSYKTIQIKLEEDTGTTNFDE